MYICSECQSEVIVDHINPPIKSCTCDGTIVASMSGGMHGVGAMNATASNNNLTEQSQVLVKAVLMALTMQEFIREGKKEIHVDAQEVIDEATGRKFTFSITGVENGI